MNSETKERIIPTLYLDYDSYLEVTSEPDSNAEWDRGSTYTSWVFNSLELTKKRGRYYESYDVAFDVSPGDNLHMIVAVWSTGDSFGNDIDYCMEIMGIYRNVEDAQHNADILRKADIKVEYKDGDGNEIKIGFLPWCGYFESLGYINVETFTVKG